VGGGGKEGPGNPGGGAGPKKARPEENKRQRFLKCKICFGYGQRKSNGKLKKGVVGGGGGWVNEVAPRVGGKKTWGSFHRGGGEGTQKQTKSFPPHGGPGDPPGGGWGGGGAGEGGQRWVRGGPD